ncbi:M20 metallopeptidase family protein [Breznakiella homolactica]|uniref:Amidohydrolase n=1 Tax=Breznakiella homolactica TaxID=2798577 RepID=A0A7T7XPI2_9SPIR|nr:M20 family metallopeptidase [Breznakiella homolactica]QQO10135.1 amidohydrolase [Breznakiella homolactica]
MPDIKKMVSEITPEITELCNHIHENPELSLKEIETSRLLEEYIEKNVVYERKKRVAETGLFVEIKGTKPGSGKVLAFRGDIDALPIQEAEGMPHRSKVPGVMHACGHDVHGTINAGAARILSDCRDQFSGSVYFFFQPAEEILKGAMLFLNDPDIDMSRIDAAAAVHSSPEFHAGAIGVRYGAILASADEIRITVRGKGGHGAHPHTFIDPVLTASSIIMNLQTLVARETSPADSAVVSICSIHGGNAHNIVPDEVVLTGTCRTINPETRNRMEESIKRIAKSTAEALRASADVEYIRGVPPLLSEDEWVDRAVRVGTRLLGEENVVMLPHPSMGGDDFAFIKENRPGVFVRLGARTPGGPYGSLHSSTFYSDPAAIPAGMLTIVGLALDFFGAEY